MLTIGAVALLDHSKMGGRWNNAGRYLIALSGRPFTSIQAVALAASSDYLF
jgi:hypothetical protein